MYEITYKFGYDELQNMPAEKAAKEANERIKGRLKSICYDFKAAIANSGMPQFYIGNMTEMSTSAISKSLTKSFSMYPDRLNRFCSLLFPEKSLDEIFFGESLPMPIPNIDRSFLQAYSYFYYEGTTTRKRDESYIKELIASKTPAQATPFSRYMGVRTDRWTDDPIRREYRQFKPIENLTFYSMWRADKSKPHMQTLLRCAYYCDMSLDFLIRNDYSCCNLYVITADGGKTAVSAEDKLLLKDYCQLAYADKVEIIGEILKRIDFERYVIDLNLPS